MPDLGLARWKVAALAWLALVAFAPSSHAEVPLKSVEIAQARTDDAVWNVIKDTTNVGLLEGFLEGFPDSPHAPAARARLATLKSSASPPAGPARPSPAPAPAPPTATAAPPPPSAVPPPAPARPPAAAAPVVTETFIQPRQGGDDPYNLRVDRCLGWARECDKPAADKFCVSRGFARAQSFTVDTGWTAATWVAGDRQICGTGTCIALASVTCADKIGTSGPPQEETIPNPRANNLPVASCFWPGRECGQSTANTYCQAIGYGRASNFGQAIGVRSVHLGDRTVCEGGAQCRALINLVCNK